MDANGCFYAAGGRGAGEWESKKISAWRGCRSHAETKKVKGGGALGGAPVFTFSSLTDKNTFACQSKVQEP